MGGIIKNSFKTKKAPGKHSPVASLVNADNENKGQS
jgi:hypothetical protein